MMQNAISKHSLLRTIMEWNWKERLLVYLSTHMLLYVWLATESSNAEIYVPIIVSINIDIDIPTSCFQF
jgi:hypothetical protein